MQFIFLPNKDNAPRFAFVVAISVDKRATKRNRVKRLLREAAQRLLPQIHGNIDVVLIARSKNEEQIDRSVGELFGRAGLL